jgi:catechol 2,3-dioxygenase-like lactoylglutathione lyase family enzyme
VRQNASFGPFYSLETQLYQDQTMHKSRLAGLIIDCNTDDLEAAAEFWSEALGVRRHRRAAIAPAERYITLDTLPDELHVEVQKVDHPPRVHLDIEADDIEAEVERLRALGARKIADIEDWCVMEAPTGQYFCVVPVESVVFEERARTWK